MTTKPKKKAASKKKAPPRASVVFGAKLRAARGDRTQAEIAALARIGLNKISPIERGRVDIRLTTAERLAAAVGVRLRDLMP